MPPPKVPVPRATQIATSHSTDYQPLPTSAEHVRDRSLSLDADRDDDVHPQIPLNGLRKQSAEREEMGKKGWYVLGSCFAASGFVTVSGHRRSIQIEADCLPNFDANLAIELLVPSRICDSHFRPRWSDVQY
jgi:hypothetical protein